MPSELEKTDTHITSGALVEKHPVLPYPYSNLGYLGLILFSKRWGLLAAYAANRLLENEKRNRHRDDYLLGDPL